MLKKGIGVFICLAVLLTWSAAWAALPGNSITYKTVLKTDDYFVAVKTDAVDWAEQSTGEMAMSLTLRWSYAKPEKFARAYPAVKEGFVWRISRYAVQYDPYTGFVKLLDIETALYNRQGQQVALLRSDKAGWRILLPTDPEYEAFDRSLNYLAETAR